MCGSDSQKKRTANRFVFTVLSDTKLKRTRKNVKSCQKEGDKLISPNKRLSPTVKCFGQLQILICGVWTAVVSQKINEEKLLFKDPPAFLMIRARWQSCINGVHHHAPKCPRMKSYAKMIYMLFKGLVHPKLKSHPMSMQALVTFTNP